MARSEVAEPPAGSPLDGLPALAVLSDELAQLVTASFTPVTYEFGETIVREGDPSDGFYVVASGLARVLTERADGTEVPLGVLRPGDSFGETAMLEGSARTATVRASSAVETLRLEAAVFDALVRLHPPIREAFERQARARQLSNFLKLHSPFSELPQEAAMRMLDEAQEVELAPGDVAFREGDEGDSMYVVEDGRVAVYAGEPPNVVELAVYRTGEFFGERSLFLGQPRAGTVEALEPTKLIVFGRPTFEWLAAEYDAFRARVEERIEAYRRQAEAVKPTLDELLPADASEAAAVEELAALDEAAPPASSQKRRASRRFPHVRQLDEMDCGAASVAMICRYFGRAVSISFIRDAIGTGVDGTSLRGIQRGGERVGLDVKAVKTSKDRLEDVPLPAIIHWGGNHWVVLYAVEAKHVRIADPGVGLRHVSRDELNENWTGFAALPSPTEQLQDAPVARISARWMMPFVRPFIPTLVIAFVLAIIGAALEMLLPVITQRIVDDVLGSRNYNLLHILAGSMLGLLGLALGIGLLQGRLLSRAANTIDAQTLDYISTQMLRLPMSYFETRRTGDLERRLDGMQQVRQLVVQQGIRGMTAFTQLAAAFVIMGIYSWLVLVIFAATLPVYAVIMRYSRRRLRPMMEQLENAFGRYRSRQIDALKGIETIKSHGAEEGTRKRIVAEFTALTDRMFKADMSMAAYYGVVSLATFTTSLLILWVGALQVLAGRLTVGGLISINSLVLLATGPLLILLSLWDQLQVTSVLLGRVQDILDQEPEQGADHSNLLPVEQLEGRVTLRNVGFHYPTAPNAKVLDGISVDIAPGTKVALVGRSGSGKSTLLRAIAGLIEITDGSIAYDGAGLHELRHQELRQKVGFVLQHSYLFDDTIARNIAFGEEDPDLDRVRVAAEIANADDFIERLALGYETRIGESGMRLSGGQAQRIAIARAVYHRPPVLLFDEATSALDTESERLVKENMDRLLEGRTAFITAHRLSTIRDADLILVLEQGRLAEHGRHEELMRRDGLYRYLHDQQLSG
jgi:ABC-type bacteriocin/lantibiotic exporter with double-glycine peptidase domain/CRP-like cAMP-binding protein